jgi:hypothetical protein
VGVALDPVRSASACDVVPAGLAVACGLGSRVLPYGPPDARRHLDCSVRQLSGGLRELVGRAQAMVDAALLSQRL